MITDPWPRRADEQSEYRRSDALSSLDRLPPAGPLRELTVRLFGALESGQAPAVRRVSAELAEHIAGFYRLPAPEIRVLGVRPHRMTEGVCTYELHGDYTPSSGRIRVWMRTAVRARVCAPRAFLNTLLHEACHHLDCAGLQLPESYHTRGFFSRVDGLYHHALGTPPEERRRLVWVRSGAGWRLDWARTRGARGPR